MKSHPVVGVLLVIATALSAQGVPLFAQVPGASQPSAGQKACAGGDAGACKREHAAAATALEAGRQLYLTKDYQEAITRFEEAAHLDSAAADQALAAAVRGAA